MPKTRPPYAPEFRQQMVDLVRAGRDPQDLAREFEPSGQAIRNWVADADRRDGRREPKPAAVDVATAPLVALGPGLVGMRAEPVGGDDRKSLERGPQSLNRAGEMGQAPHRADDMGRVGPLPSVLDQEALLATQDEQSVEE